MSDKCWESEVLEGCPKLEALLVNMPWDIWAMVMTMTSSVKTEWLGYFNGEVDGDEFNVTSLIVPEQKVNNVSVEVEEEMEGVIGVVHSHPFSTHGTPSFSKIDDNSINVNHYFSIVVGKNGDYEGVSRQLTPCGEWCIGEVILEIAEPDFIIEAKSKLKEIRPKAIRSIRKDSQIVNSLTSQAGLRRDLSKWKAGEDEEIDIFGYLGI